MVTISNGLGVSSITCKSTDTKPTVDAHGLPLVNGSLLYEMDTQTFYMWDADGETWIEQ